MKIAEDFRSLARESLIGKWSVAVGAGIVASLLGAGDTNTLDFSFKANVPTTNEQIISGSEIFESNIGALFFGGFSYIWIAAFLIGILFFVLGSFISVGYAKFNLNLIDRKEVSVDTLFNYLSYWKTTAISRFLRTLFISLWSLLFIVPGIVASLSYAMTDYILAENPEITAREAIEKSKMMMKGNRWRLFCLEFSFFGWILLSALTCGIGFLWLTPYMSAAYAAFYREVSQRETVLNEL